MWIFKNTLIVLHICPFFIVEIFCLFTFFLFSLDPLIDFYVSPDLDSLIFEVVQNSISALNLGMEISCGVDQLEVMIIHDAIGRALFARFSGLGDDFVDFYLSSLVHPDHWEGSANENDTEDEFGEWTSFLIFFTIFPITFCFSY